jgi:hypothetical protein
MPSGYPGRSPANVLEQTRARFRRLTGEDVVQGSEDTERPPLEELRAQQERELATNHALASMEYALAREAFHVGIALRRAGIGFDPRTFVALRILEASLAELADPSGALETMQGNGSLERSVEIATDLLERDAA